MKKPVITRQKTIVMIECHEETSAKECEKQINKILNNRMLQLMALRKIRNR